MDKQTSQLEKERKTHAITITLVGVLIGILPFMGEIGQKWVGGVGVILFIVGITKLRTQKTWSELTEKERKSRIITMAVLAFLIIAILVIFFLG